MVKMGQQVWLSLIKRRRKNYFHTFRTSFHSSSVLGCSKSEKTWNAAIGLEIHAQIATKSKLFSGASTKFASPVNNNAGLFDCAIPGTLPVLNRKCVEAGVITALALSCKINEMSSFERKHYFYADMPAGYQITQQREPLASNGKISFHVFTPGIHKEPYITSARLKQIQLEQDSGRMLREESIGRNLVDLNRAGVPLMELVFEPDLIDGEEASALVKELTLILETLGTCSCKMEVNINIEEKAILTVLLIVLRNQLKIVEGALRVDANVSVSKKKGTLGVRTEIKNIHSSRAVAAAVKSEIKRQITILEQGGEITNETRAWDAESKTTISMRDKEGKQDYRFMPETNLPPLFLHVRENTVNANNLVDVVSLKRKLPELPEETRSKLKGTYNVHPATVGILVADPLLLQLFTAIIEKDKNRDAKILSLFLVKELLAFLYEENVDLKVCLDHSDFIGEIIDLLQSKSISLNIAPGLLKTLLTNPEKMPRQIVQENDWYLISADEDLEKICRQVLEENPKAVKQYKAGKRKVLQFFLRHVYIASNQRAEMLKAKKILEEMLS